jgi:serine/threonine protein kinase
MLSGRPPHYSKNRKQMLRDIVEKRVEMKSYFSTEAKSLLRGLLDPNPTKRIGSTEEDADELKRHPWFKNIDWEKLNRKEITPPFKPYVTGPEDLRNIDKIFLNEPAKDTPSQGIMSSVEKKKAHFD